jgi:DNA-binding NtrC family response regulator
MERKRMTPRSEKRSLTESLPVPSRGTVFLVDEDAADLHYYSAMLQGQGYLVRPCESYAEGADRLDSEVFDLIVVCQGSPNFEGRSVLERAMELDRHSRVLIVARCLDMNCYLEAMQLGAADYLAEPFSASEMTRALETHLRFSKVVA